jgi:chloramphenicol 3-O phosphotransferase
LTQEIGTIVVLNGTSSSGKTLTAQALQPHLGAGCVVTGLDDILERIQPFGSESGGLLSSVFRMARIVRFQVTGGRFRLFQQLHREVVAMARSGRPVIVETALMEQRALLDAAECFAPLNGFFVAMKPPLEVSETWESARADRPCGQARKHYALIHAHGTYDLELDPSTLTPTACAEAIMRRLSGTPPDTFKRLMAQSTP